MFTLWKEFRAMSLSQGFEERILTVGEQQRLSIGGVQILLKQQDVKTATFFEQEIAELEAVHVDTSNKVGFLLMRIQELEARFLHLLKWPGLSNSLQDCIAIHPDVAHTIWKTQEQQALQPAAEVTDVCQHSKVVLYSRCCDRPPSFESDRCSWCHENAVFLKICIECEEEVIDV